MNKRILLALLIVFLGFVLRFWRVGSIPPGLNRDEASIGYTAYSLLLTGKDEYGKSFPFSIKSFGDWKLPLYIYADILPLKFYSLSEFSVRLPSLLFGTASLAIVYFLVLALFKNENSKQLISLVATFLFSVSAWHIHFSRVVSEANLSVFFVSLGLLLFVKGIQLPVYLFFSSFIFALSLCTYHGNHVFTPLIFLGLVFILVKRGARKKTIAVFFVPFILFALVIYKQTLFSADKTKLSGLTPLYDKYLVYDKIILPRLDHADIRSVVTLAYHNKLSFLIARFLEGYWRSFSTEFLFLKGGISLQHNIPNFGNLYMWEAPFIIFGLYFLFHKSYSWRWLFLYWLLISPIPASITKDAPHSARMLSVLPLPHILAAVGLVELILLIKIKYGRFLCTCFGFISVFLLLINFSIFLDRYFLHFPKASEVAWGGGYKELVPVAMSLQNGYEEMIMDRPNYSPYIYFLFYQKTDPSIFQKHAIRYPEDEDGYQHVKQFGNLTFKKLDWSYDLLIPNRLLIAWSESTPVHATKSAFFVDKPILNSLEDKFGQSFGLQIGDKIHNKLVRTIRLENGQPQFYLIEVVRIPKADFVYDYKQD